MTDPLDQRRPRERESAYLGWVARLPCIACMVHGRFNRRVQVAHLRAGSIEHDKRPTGMAEKPDDRWTTPLCQPHHTGDDRRARLSQHTMGELDFWETLKVNPFELCIALADAYDHGRDGKAVIANFAAIARAELAG